MTSKFLQRVLCLAVLALGSTAAQSQTSEGAKTMEHAQIQKLIDQSNAAVLARDIDAIMATYEPTAAMAGPPGAPLSTGTPALREAFKNFLAINPDITMTKSDLIVSGDIALHSYVWKMSAKLPDGSPMEQSGLATVVLRKQPDGRWLMVIDNPFGDQLLYKK
jgi:uncharacterized protein (TIGR02246 family)